jgi:lysophospholipase L1-like esterase
MERSGLPPLWKAAASRRTPRRKPTLAICVLLITAACQRAVTPMNTKTQTAQPRPLETIRVVALGDSLAYGAGDESGKGLAGRLKEDLRDRGFLTVDTTNLGVNGAQTGDVIARLKQERVRTQIEKADAIVLSIGANDLFRSPAAREETLRAPLAVADRILQRIESIVAELRRMNPRARILILGGYNPVPTYPYASLINQYLELWDATLASRFKNDPLVTVVKMSDIVTPQRLSRYDNFHPGGAAYASAAQRIADILSAS